MADETDALTCSCPQCETRFRVTEEQLAVAGGRVRCGACLTVFDCSDLLQAGIEEDVAAPAPRIEAPPKPDIPPIKTPEIAVDAPRDQAEIAVDAQRDRAEVAVDAQRDRAEIAVVAQRDRAAIAVVAPRDRAETAAAVPVGMFASGYALAVILLAVLVFGLQYPAWSQDPALRGVYEAACGIGVCELAPLRALAAIEVKPSAPVRQSDPPEITLHVELINRAPFRQPSPDLAITIVDVGHRVIVEQQFTPQYYLPTGHSRRMDRDRPVMVELRLADPGEDAAAYMLALL